MTDEVVCIDNSGVNLVTVFVVFEVFGINVNVNKKSEVFVSSCPEAVIVRIVTNDVAAEVDVND